MQSVINENLTPEEISKVLEFFPKGLIAIDLETTGLSPLVDRIIEIAAVKISSEEKAVFQTLVNPQIPIPPHTIDIHHITDEMVKDAPLIDFALNELKQFIGNTPIVAHNAKFDIGFIVMGMQKAQLDLTKNEIYCSCKLARQSHPDLPNHKLATLVESFNIPLLNHHRATDDAMAGLKVFIQSLFKTKKDSGFLERNGLIFRMDDFGKLKPAELPEKLASLEKLVKEAAVIEIKYTGGNYKNQFRPVKLTSLLNTPDGNILYARCLLSDMQKSFKIKKIAEIKMPSAEDIQKWLKKI